MIPVAFESDRAYLQSCTTVEDKIAACDAIIDALFTQMLALAQQESPIQEYMLNDGQTIIKAIYRDAKQITMSIDALTKIRNRYANQGRRVMHMIDGKNLIGPNYR